VGWFGYEQVNVLGHDDVSVNPKLVNASHAFERVEEDVTDSRIDEVWLSSVTAEGHEM